MATTIHSVATDVNDLKVELKQLKSKHDVRFRAEFNLGYVLFAFSGENRAIDVNTDFVQGNWDKFKTSKIETGHFCLEVSNLILARQSSGSFDLALADAELCVLPVSGNRFTWRSLHLSFVLTCAKADPIGTFLVLGFKTNS